MDAGLEYTIEVNTPSGEDKNKTQLLPNYLNLGKF
jgi:hypothetical protein